MARKSKKQTVEKHFAIRCIQRLGYIPDEKQLVKDIQEGKLEFYEKLSNRVSHWRWTDPITGTKCILPYDRERKQLITVLFEDLREYHKKQKEIYERLKSTSTTETEEN